MLVTLLPGTSQNISQQGGRFYYTTGDEKINVKLIGNGDARDFDLYPRQGINSNERFYGVSITNLGDETATIEFEISDREVFDNRIPEVTQIEPIGGSLPVEIVSPLPMPVEIVAPDPLPVEASIAGTVSVNAENKDSSVIVAKGLASTVGTGNDAECIAMRLGLGSYNSEELLIKRISVRLEGDQFAQDLEVGLCQQTTFATRDSLTNVYAKIGKLGSQKIFGDLVIAGSSLNRDVDMVALLGTSFDDAYVLDSVVTSSTLPCRNVVFDLSQSIFDTGFELGLGALGSLFVYVRTLDGSPVVAGTGSGSVVVNFFGERYEVV